MDPEIKQLWLDALRSNQYRQGRGFLCQGNEYCCLGVLCELAVQKGVIPQGKVISKLNDSPTLYGLNWEHKTKEYLPGSVQRWANLPSGDPQVLIDGIGTPLSSLNDSGKNFKQIAQLIEEQL